jgi:endonuclease/exonuclease/phosphatase family metal-dependent hydrolase
MGVLASFVARCYFCCAFLLIYVCSADTGTFDILTYNIAGLPDFLTDNGVPGDKETNARAIGSLFAKYDYDIIHVQEVRRHNVLKPRQLTQDLEGLRLPFRPLQSRHPPPPHQNIRQRSHRLRSKHALEVPIHRSRPRDMG